MNLITINKNIPVEEFEIKNSLNFEQGNILYDKSVFFDLEHYIYKKPICVGIFGACFYDSSINKIRFTQYMIENNNDSKKIISCIEKYFYIVYNNHEIRHCVTFSGNNDFTVLKYLFNEYNINTNTLENFIKIDIQKEYEKLKDKVIGLKELEKYFEIYRQNEVIAGSTLAKTICRLNRDPEYISRMPESKRQNMLKYNEQDVISLFYMFINWNKYMK